MNYHEKVRFFKKNKSDFRYRKTVIAFVMVALLLFFTVQFLSQLLFRIGTGKTAPHNNTPLKWSSLLSPLDARTLLEYGYTLLEENKKSHDPGILEESIKYLKKSIAGNMLYYNGHLYLGKAYLEQNLTDYTRFESAVAAFKRAALIRGKDSRVSLDTMTILLSLWPHLDENDKTFCSDLLNRSIKSINKEEFSSLLDVWGLNCKDVNFLKNGLDKMPQFYLLAAQKLSQLEMDMPTRRELMAKQTLYAIAKIKDLYQGYLAEPPADLINKLESIFISLGRDISPYYLDENVTKSKQRSYHDFKRNVIKSILEALFAHIEGKKNSRIREKIETYIFSNIKDLSSMEDLKNFENFLEQKGYFVSLDSDLGIFYIKQLMAFKSGQYDSVIVNIENFKRSVSFVKKEFAGVYADLLLLLTDAYISSRLLTRANETLKEVNRNDVNPPDFFWRKKIIERVIGVDGQETAEQCREFELIDSSRFIEITSTSTEKTVYLINSKEVNISFADTLYEKIKTYHLLQVFVDGNLVYEEYLSKLVPPIKISILSEKNYSRHTLNIKITR